MNVFRTAYRVPIYLAHAIAAVTSLLVAFLLRFDFMLPWNHADMFLAVIPFMLFCKLTACWLFRCDRGGWRYVSLPDLQRLVLSNAIGSFLFAAFTFLQYGSRFPTSIYIIDFLLFFMACATMRIFVRIYATRHYSRTIYPVQKRLLLYGAGSTAIILLKEIRDNPSLGYKVLGLLDDDPLKQNSSLLGVDVLGTGRDACAIVERFKRRGEPVDEILIAIPSATGRQMREAVANCRATGIPCKTIPGVGELLTGRVLTSQIRNISVEDLLGRSPVKLDEQPVRRAIEGLSIMVTGGGGSIGSELCRQVASFHPSRLVIFERSENDLFHVHLGITSRFPDLDVVPVVGDIREPERVDEVIRRYQVDSIFHAAAYKHVPIMETHVLEAVKNNIVGTFNLVEAAARNRVSQFLMISTDKAVNPSSIMGLTKRAAEILVSSMPVATDHNRTKFVSVRFGNVLGSNGSVVPLFREQIAAGGPVTVTHPEMRRYFMTIREAVALVLQASTMGKGSEIFLLDMGEPIHIVDLARNMIRLSGKIPDVDIEIRFTGLRPGEKLFEELALQSEHIVPTSSDKIRIFRGPTKDLRDSLLWMKELLVLVEARDEHAIVAHLHGLVPEYQAPSVSRKPPHPALSELRTHAATA